MALDVGSLLSSAGGLLNGVAGVSNVFGNLFGGDDYYQQAQDAFMKQKQLMKENNEYQSAENEKSRQFTKDMYNKQWNDVTSWNDFSSIAQRAQNAGVSPSAIFGNGAPSVLGGVSPASVGHSATPSPSYADIVNPVNRQAETFHSVASGLQALGNLTKMGVETSTIRPLMSANIKNMLSSAGLNDIRAKSEDFELGLRQIYGKKLYDSELGLNFAKAIDLYSSAYLNAEQGKTQESVRELNLANRLLKDAQRDSTDRQIQMFDLQLAWYPKEMEAKINNLNSESEENRASAQEHRANAEVLKNEARIRSVVADVKEYGKTKELQAVVDELNAKQAISQQQYKQASVLIKRLNVILENYGTVAGSKEVDADIENFFKILGLSTSVGFHN